MTLESAFYDGSPPGKRELHALDRVRQVNNGWKTWLDEKLHYQLGI